MVPSPYDARAPTKRDQESDPTHTYQAPRFGSSIVIRFVETARAHRPGRASARPPRTVAMCGSALERDQLGLRDTVDRRPEGREELNAASAIIRPPRLSSVRLGPVCAGRPTSSDGLSSVDTERVRSASMSSLVRSPSRSAVRCAPHQPGPSSRSEPSRSVPTRLGTTRTSRRPRFRQGCRQSRIRSRSWGRLRSFRLRACPRTEA